MNGRLTALDDSFLAVESATAHMHVGWAASFAQPDDGPAPSFTQLRDHIEARLCRAPRYRQKIAPVPLGLNTPVWIDDEDFDVARHVTRSGASTLEDLVDGCMSTQLPRDRPLWQICISERLADGRVGVVGKAHHCMVDGIAAVELASLLLDPTADPPALNGDQWEPSSPPGALRRAVAGVTDRVLEGASLARLPVRLLRSPRRVTELAGRAGRALDALAQSVRPARPVAPLNEPISPDRHLAWVDRPLADLKRIGRSFGVTVNDVLLAAAAGGVRRYMRERDRQPEPLKTMVPVNLRPDGQEDQLGNRISFLFVDLPCDEPDPVRRLQNVRFEMNERKETGVPEGAETALEAVRFLPRPLQHAASRLIASPRTFNLTVSNIPGPREPMYMRGCELEAAYPVVPISDQHALSIGMTTIKDRACFGFYAAKQPLPDADSLAEAVDVSIDELLECAEPDRLAVGVQPV
jgi:diacylglycerol O-acyltransferase / wax synthase